VNTNLKKSTSVIAGGLLIFIVGGVIIAGYFTNWFGLIQQSEIQSLSIKGSTTVEPIALAVATAYMENNPNVDVIVTGGGSSAGINGVASGTVDIGMTSRNVKSSEYTLTPSLIEWPICADGIALIVNTQNPITNLTGDVIRGIFNGTITNWNNASAFGADAWDNAVIVVINRDSASGTREFFRTWMGLDFTDDAIEYDSNGAVRAAVNTTKYAIGYVGLGYVDTEIITPLEVDDGSGFIAPSVETVQDGSYYIARDLYMLTNGSLIEQNNLVQAYFDFILSRIGQYIVKYRSFVPLNLGFIL